MPHKCCDVGGWLLVSNLLINRRIRYSVRMHWLSPAVCRRPLPKPATKTSHPRHKATRSYERWAWGLDRCVGHRWHSRKGERSMTLWRSSLLALAVSAGLIGGATLAAADGPGGGFPNIPWTWTGFYAG